MAGQQVTPMRELSLEGCPCIGRGRNGAVYRLPEDRIVKIYKPGPQVLAQVRQEQENASNALRLGVPTARVFDIVRCGEDIGLVLEEVKAMSLRQVIANQPERLEELALAKARLLRHLHGLKVPAGTFPSMREIYHQRAAGLADLLTPEEIALLEEMIDSIPEGLCYLHGDFHRGNIMVRGEELLLIDMADSSQGHPFYDVLGTYMLGMNLAKNFPEAFVTKLVGWDVKTIERVWTLFKRHYFQTDDEGELAELEAMLESYCPLRWLTFLKIAPNMTGEMQRQSVAEARQYFFPCIRQHIERFRDRLETWDVRYGKG